jgi:hypothetical protein
VSYAPAPRIERGPATKQGLSVGEQPARDLRRHRVKFVSGPGVSPAEQRVPGVADDGLWFDRHDMQQCNVGIRRDERLCRGHGCLPCPFGDPDENAHFTLLA